MQFSAFLKMLALFQSNICFKKMCLSPKVCFLKFTLFKSNIYFSKFPFSEFFWKFVFHIFENLSLVFDLFCCSKCFQKSRDRKMFFCEILKKNIEISYVNITIYEPTRLTLGGGGGVVTKGIVVTVYGTCIEYGGVRI